MTKRHQSVVVTDMSAVGNQRRALFNPVPLDAVRTPGQLGDVLAVGHHIPQADQPNIDAGVTKYDHIVDLLLARIWDL